MTVLPDRACLRRYALPGHFLSELGQAVAVAAPNAACAAAAEAPPVPARRRDIREPSAPNRREQGDPAG